MFKFAKKSLKAADASVSESEALSSSLTFREQLKTGLSKTRHMLFGDIRTLFSSPGSLDSISEELETRLLMADVGVSATCEIIDDLRQNCRREDAVPAFLKARLLSRLKPHEQALELSASRPMVILVIGVNGVGKTTTIGKMARRYQQQGHQVMLAAGDTFRAAAVEQLQAWGARNDVPVIAQSTGADAASVIFDAAQAAYARKVDVLIADTAGRLHNKANLMDELSKIKRVLGKLDAKAPHETLLVVDAGTGQNAVVQTEQFHNAVGVTGLVLTKLDGTAKGGVLFALARQFDIPVRYIGIGEKAADLCDFNAEDFIDALIG